FENAGIKYELTSVGDRFVYECMQKNGYRLGGEQSGHIILRKYATTGDGLLTAIMLTEEMRDRKTTLSKLAEPVKLYPQTVKSIRVTSKEAALSDPDVQAEFDAINKEINGNGRALLRASGTEPVVRIMLECETEELCRKYTDRLFEIMNKRGYCCE
ncbi:MAG: phosphoglucosamine mutase, partial [Eubacteriales bacterium]